MEEGNNLPLELDPNNIMEADEEILPYAEEDWYKFELKEVPQNKNEAGATFRNATKYLRKTSEKDTILMGMTL